MRNKLLRLLITFTVSAFLPNINAQEKELEDFKVIFTDFENCRNNNKCIEDIKEWHEDIGIKFKKLIVTNNGGVIQ